MKRIGGLWERVLREGNLHEAFARAAAGKRDRLEVRRFAARLDENLRGMARDLAAGVFPFGRYRRFTIYEPKERVIHAAAFPERVAHHALMAVCGPVLERCLTRHRGWTPSGSNRVNRGGSWNNNAINSRVANRNRNNPSNRNNNLGFRPARAHPRRRETRGPRLSRRPTRPRSHLRGKPQGPSRCR